MSLPPGATLVSGDVPAPQMALPPGATLVSGGSPDPQAAIKQKYGLPASVDLSKTLTENWGSVPKEDFNKIDIDKFSRAYQEANPQAPTPTSFLGRSWDEVKNLFKGTFGEGALFGGSGQAGGVGGANLPSDPRAVIEAAKRRGTEFAEHPAAAAGATTVDIGAALAPFVLDRFLGAKASAGEGAAAGAAEGSAVKSAAAPGATPSASASAGVRTTPFAPPSTTIGSALGATAPAAVEASSRSFASRLGIVDGPFDQMLTQAIKPGKNNNRWKTDVNLAQADMLAAEEKMGRPIGGIDDVIEAANTAKKAVWQEYQAKLTEAKARNPNAPSMMTIDGNKIADAMMSSLDERTKLQHPEVVERVQKIADTYRRSMSLDEAEDFLQSINNDLHSYYAKNKVNQQVAARDPAMAPTVAEGDELRKQLYSTLDNLTGPGAAQIKQRYGALSNIETEAIGRRNVAARQQPQSLAEQIGMARAAGKIAVGIARVSPATILEGTESLAASKWLKERNTTDAIIGRAFDKARGASAEPVRDTPWSPSPVPAATLGSLLGSQGAASGEQQQSQQ